MALNIKTLNIKNPEVYRLTRELSLLTGESMTEAVHQAVRERLQRVRRDQDDGFVDRLLAIGRDVRARLPADWQAVDHGELLYDEHGLPK